MENRNKNNKKNSNLINVSGFTMKYAAFYTKNKKIKLSLLDQSVLINDILQCLTGVTSKYIPFYPSKQRFIAQTCLIEVWWFFFFYLFFIYFFLF